MAIGAYGIVNSVAFMFLMVVLGVTQGMQPIVGYNYGAKRMDRVLKCLKLSLVLGGLVTTVGFMASEFIPGLLASAFTTDRKLIDLSVIGFRILMAMSPVIGLQVVAASFFQSVGFAKKAIFLSLTRQLIFLIPGLLIFPLFMGLNGVWFACPVADFSAFVITMIMLKIQIKKMKAPDFSVAG